jgi:hypothetical protein
MNGLAGRISKDLEGSIRSQARPDQEIPDDREPSCCIGAEGSVVPCRLKEPIGGLHG